MPGKRQKAYELHLKGKSTDAIAKNLRVTEDTVIAWIHAERDTQRGTWSKSARPAKPSAKARVTRSSTSPRRFSLQGNGTVRKQEARRMAQAGASKEEIAQRFGVSTRTVTEVWAPDIFRENRRRLRERARRMVRDGVSDKQVASVLGVPRKTIRDWTADVLRDISNERKKKEIDPIRDMALRGATTKQIMHKFGISRHKVEWHAGDILRKNKSRTESEMKKEVIRLAEAGVSRNEISRRIGIHTWTVTKWAGGVLNARARGEAKERK
jgi:DNA-binding CsgD family transcriptional regulator